MILTKGYDKSVELASVAGLGPTAWNHGTSQITVALSGGGDHHHIVRINHDERKETVARQQDNVVVDKRRFDEAASPGISATVHLPFIASLLALAVLGLS